MISLLGYRTSHERGASRQPLFVGYFVNILQKYLGLATWFILAEEIDSRLHIKYAHCLDYHALLGR